MSIMVLREHRRAKKSPDTVETALTIVGK